LVIEYICAFGVNPMPNERRNAFEWFYSKPNVKVLGWYGLIQRTSTIDGECLVELKVIPRLAGFGAVTSTNDYCIETWKYSSDNKLVFQKCVHQPGPVILFGD
jgi:hypothetical protein